MAESSDLLEQIVQLLALGHESRSFEVKGPLSLAEKAHCAKVSRAVMAMGNLRDGGIVLIGVDEAQMTEMLPGLDDQAFEAWSDFDNVSDALARYAEPPVAFTLHPLNLPSGAKAVALVVSEFDDIPHVCKRDFQGELQDGAVYVRPRGKPESRQPSSADMRDLLDLAITKGVREFVRRAGQAGIPLGVPRPQEELDRETYIAESEAAWGAPTTVMETILAAGHTEASVRPTIYDKSRISPAALRKFITDNTVRMRGWPLPFLDDREDVIRFQDSVGQDVEPKVVPHIEAWRMCTSGQFLHRRVLSGDLRDVQEAQPSDPASTGVVIVWDVLLYLVELAEFGARLAASLEQDAITFDIRLDQISGRELVSGDWQRELHGPYKMSANTLTTSLDVTATRLAVEPRSVGVELAQSLLKQFGLDVPDRVLDDWQAQVFNR